MLCVISPEVCQPDKHGYYSPDDANYTLPSMEELSRDAEASERSSLRRVRQEVVASGLDAEVSGPYGIGMFRHIHVRVAAGIVVDYNLDLAKYAGRRFMRHEDTYRHESFQAAIDDLIPCLSG
jgi:hypothetical protein